MKNFKHVNAATFEEACNLLNKPGGTVQAMAGGTDLLGIYKDGILEEYPDTVVNLKTIPGIDCVEERDGALVIGAGCKLGELEKLPLLRESCPALAEAARSVASPLIRNLATIGGNICQDARCWYYRYPDSIGGAMKCLRKGGDTCYAIKGENRYHSVFGGMQAHATGCMQKCPAGTDIPGYMEQLRQGNVEGAARIIMQVNPMPMITSRVCAHWCHGGCIRKQYDERVAIGSVERFVGDYVLEHSDLFYVSPETSTGKSVAIVGSGPSGLAAAYYLRQAGIEVTVYEEKKEAGGMLLYTIPAYRLPKDIVRRTFAALAGMGVKFVPDTAIGKDVAPADLGKNYDSVYYATGAWKRPLLGLAGEELTVFGLGLIEVSEETQMTSREGVFAGGDITTGPASASVIKAIATGRRAALGMSRYLGVNVPVVQKGKAKFTTFDLDGIEQPKMARRRERALGDRAPDKEDSLGLEAAEAMGEAKRCLDCACYSVNPSDIAPVLVMLGAEIVTTERTLPAEEFLTTRLNSRDNLRDGELVKEIRVPRPNGLSHYDKLRVRDVIDFAIVSLASCFKVRDGAIREASVVFGGVAPVPYRAVAVEEYLKGKTITKTVAAEAAELAVKGACFMKHNEFKLHDIKYLLKQAILRALG